MDDSRAAITALMFAYCEAIDTGDFDAFAGLFEHATWFMTRERGPGAAAVKTWLDANIILYHGEPRTKHVTTNVVVDVDEAAGTARASSYITIYQAVPGFPLQAIYSGRYRDRFERVDGRWCFRDRDVISDLFGDMSRHIRQPPPIGPAPRT